MLSRRPNPGIVTASLADGRVHGEGTRGSRPSVRAVSYGQGRHGSQGRGSTVGSTPQLGNGAAGGLPDWNK